MKQDEIFKQPIKQLVDFNFNTEVVDVFPDMIRRSVPGYETIIALLGVMGHKYAQEGSNIYDLGCSLGAATLSVYQQIQQPNVRYICIDNSEEMIQQCKANLLQHMPNTDVAVRCEDIRKSDYVDASLVIINFTLQFLSPIDRLQLLQNIYAGMRPGACLVLSEKLHYNDQDKQNHLTELHHEFKRTNHYSDLEIAQKRTALENVLVPDTPEAHLQRLKDCGFKHSHQWFQCFTFSSFIAIKPL